MHAGARTTERDRSVLPSYEEAPRRDGRGLTRHDPYAELWVLSQDTHDAELDIVRSVLLGMGDTLATVAFSATTKRVI